MSIRFRNTLFICIILITTSLKCAFARISFCEIYKEIELYSTEVLLPELIHKRFSSRLSENEIKLFKEYIHKLSKVEKIKLLSEAINRNANVFDRKSLMEILKRYPPEKEAEVLKAFYDLSLYSTMDDLIGVATFLKSNFDKIYVGDPLSGQLGALNYLTKKSVSPFTGITQNKAKLSLDTFLKIPAGSAVLVDSTIIEILQQNPSALLYVQEAQLNLVYLDGLTESLDYSHVLNFDAIVTKLDQQLSSAESQSIFQSTTDVRKQLEKLGIGDRFRPIYYQKQQVQKQFLFEVPREISKSELESELAYDNLVSRMSRDYVSAEEIQKRLERIPKKYQEKILDVAIADGAFKSLQNMAVDAQKLKKSIDEKVRAMGKDTEDIVYIHPDFKDEIKSMSLVGHLYQNANNIPNKSFMSFHDIAKNPKLVDGKVVVVLDDYIGSGSSMTVFAQIVKEKLPDDVPLIGATFYSTEQGKKHLQNYAKLVRASSGKSVDYVTVEVATTYDEALMATPELSDFSKGYGNSDTLFSMEYMSPDNNNSMMLPFAESFTYEPSAVKRSGSEFPD